MSLSQDQAAESLKEINRTIRRSALAYSYARTSPYLIMWGLIWMAGYGLSDLFPRAGSWHWTALTLGGLLGGIFIGRRQAASGDVPVRPGTGLQVFVTFLAIGLFITATYAIFGHTG